jgi:hypothetical protein
VSGSILRRKIVSVRDERRVYFRKSETKKAGDYRYGGIAHRFRTCFALDQLGRFLVIFGYRPHVEKTE